MNKKRILVVEDNKIIRENITVFLTKAGFEVYKASSGVTGIQKAIALLPDLIISDIMMPGLNGYEFYKSLQQLQATSVIPFIFLSSKSQVSDVRAGMTLGADDYITKPFDLMELLQAVNVRITKAEKLLLAAENKFTALINNKLTGVLVYKDDNFMFTNQKFQNITGYSEEELQGMNFSELVVEQDKDKVIEKINSVYGSADSDFELSFSLKQKNGNLIKVNLFAGIAKEQWKTIITAIVVEKQESAASIPPDDLNHISREYSANLAATEYQKQKPGLDSLTRRELEVLSLIALGLTNSEVAEKLFISTRTAEFHRSNLLSKTWSKNTAELVRFAMANGVK